MSSGDRVEAMLRRVADAVRAAGVTGAAAENIDSALRGALEHRREHLGDAHFDTLHPGRTALILLETLREADAVVLAAAALLETSDPQIAPPRSVLAAAPPEVRSVVEQVPTSADADELLERLLALPPRVQMLALAERLDHARHLHLRPSSEWEASYRVTCGAYAPVAVRSGVLDRRYAWWCGMFARRYLRRDAAGE